MRAAGYSLLRVPMRPRLSGNNIAVWRSDFERVNGFDERFVGWGLEDRDLQRRLTAVGVRVRSILHRTAPLHQWHEPAASFRRNGEGTENLAYYSRDGGPPFCADGIVKVWETDIPSLPLVFPSRIAATHHQRRAA